MMRYHQKIKCGFNRRKIEKNWGFFQHKDSLLCVYSYNPFKVLLINEKEDYFLANNLHIHQFKKLQWEKRFGEIRGGASPLLHQKHYWCVFQSHKRFNFIGTVYYIGVFYLMLSPI